MYNLVFNTDRNKSLLTKRVRGKYLLQDAHFFFSFLFFLLLFIYLPVRPTPGPTHIFLTLNVEGMANRSVLENKITDIIIIILSLWVFASRH